MQTKEKTVPLSVRFPESDVAKIAATAPGGDVNAFVREAVAAKMAELNSPISAEVGSVGGKQQGAGRPFGAHDKQPRKRAVRTA